MCWIKNYHAFTVYSCLRQFLDSKLLVGRFWCSSKSNFLILSLEQIRVRLVVFTSPISQSTKRSPRNSFHVRAFSKNERSRQQSRETCSCLAMYHGWTFLKFLAPNTSPPTCDLGGPLDYFHHDIMIHHDSQWHSLSTFGHMSKVITTIINVTLLKFNIYSYSPWNLATHPKGKYIVFQQSTSQGQNLKLWGCIQVETSLVICSRVALQNLCLANLCSSLIPLAPSSGILNVTYQS